jgi:hypothetical protein
MSVFLEVTGLLFVFDHIHSFVSGDLLQSGRNLRAFDEWVAESYLGAAIVGHENVVESEGLAFSVITLELLDFHTVSSLNAILLTAGRKDGVEASLGLFRGSGSGLGLLGRGLFNSFFRGFGGFGHRDNILHGKFKKARKR